MQIVGHTQQRDELERSESPSVLLRGPSGIGKWLCARSYADQHGGAAIVLRDRPTVEDARQVEELFQQRPLGGRFTIVLVDVDASSEAMQNTLLKTLEEMPEWGRIILVAHRRPLPTVISRCHVIEFRPLTELQVSDILVEQRVSPAEATSLAMLSAGSVERALSFRDAVKSKAIVLSYLDALVRVDRVAMSIIGMQRWSEPATVLLWRWTTEVLTDWPRVFTKEELGLVHKLGTQKFYELIAYLREGASPELAAMKVWR